MAWLDDQSKQFESYARSHQGHWFATVGDKRTDSKRGNEHGGIFWCDLSEFVPVEWLSQIFGHSCRKFPTIIGQNGDLDIFSSEICLNRPLKVEDHFSICIDTNNQHYAIIEDGEITLKPICSN